MPRAALLAVAAAGACRMARADGVATCPCINPYTHPSLQGTDGIAKHLSGNSLVRTIPGVDTEYIYPASFGTGCAAHDNNLPPSCDRAQKPAWCTIEWCYVDPDNCDVTKVKSKYFPDVTELYFSYQTCSSDGASSGSWSAEDVQFTKRLFALADNYAKGARDLIEGVANVDDGNESTSDSGSMCGLPADRQMCPCEDCYRSATWASYVDFESVGMLRDESRGNDAEKSEAACMSETVETQYKAIAAREMDADFTKVGYMYFADQKTGGYTQWPRERACDWEGPDGGSYDPRYRDWYASGATGPKDVVLVVDVSGSMSLEGRSGLARSATKQVLDTLNWKDFASIVLFNDQVSAVYSNKLVPMTEGNRAAMKSWADGEVWEGGGTNFVGAMNKALEIIASSVSSGDTCMCQKAIMFLTDGAAPFGEEDFANVKRQSIKYDIVIFSYAIGDGADHAVPKRLACENRGIFYPVEDGGNLGQVMSEYYNYFIQGQEICTTTFVRYTAVQGHQLYGACMPMYDRSGDSGTSLLGVSCLDINLIASLSDLKQQAGWEHFKCQASDSTKMCRALSISPCSLQQLRRLYSAESVCEDQLFASASPDVQCPCQDPNCQDDATFVDEKGYFCDTWVGDDCVNIDAQWGYSEAGKTAVSEKCKRSCGLCVWQEQCEKPADGECPSRPVFDVCRACQGKVSGVDIEGDPMSCPADLQSTTSKGTNDSSSGGLRVVPVPLAGLLGPLLLGLAACWSA